VKFCTKIWHPNISSVTGAICLDILKDNWAAALTLRTVLLSLQALMSSPEPDDPQDAVVAGQFKKSLTVFNQTAKYWATKYASAAQDPGSECERKIQQVCEMGFSEDKAIEALSKQAWNLQAAVQELAS